MSTFIPPTPAATKSAEQHEEPSEQNSFNHLLYKVLRLTSEQVQDLNDLMAHWGIPNVHEVIAQNFRKPHALEDNLKFITQGKTSYVQSNVMISLSFIIDLCPKVEALISQHPTRVLPLYPTNLHHNRQQNLSKCTPINRMKALLTPPKLRPPLLTLY